MADSGEGEAARALVDRIARGDVDAENELVVRYSKSLMRMLRAISSDRSLVEDVHQETFAVVLQRLRRRPLDAPEALAAFVRETARKIVMATNRKRRIKERVEIDQAQFDEIIDPSPSQLARVLLEEQRRAMRHALTGVRSRRYRQLIYRFYIEEESMENLCADFGLSPAHFYRVLFRARRGIRRVLMRNGVHGVRDCSHSRQ